MKTELLKKAVGTLGLVSALSLSMHVSFAGEGSKDGTSATATAASNEVQTGRAQLAMEDLKTLLGVTNSRDPSAVEPKVREQNEPKAHDGKKVSTESSPSQSQFFLGLSKSEKKDLTARIFLMEKQRRMLASHIADEAAKKKATLRTERHGIQTARLTAREDQDQALSKKLYDSLLEEANLEAQGQQKLAAFDQSNAVLLDFVEINGARRVAAIHIGHSTVWDSEAQMNVAQK